MWAKAEFYTLFKDPVAEWLGRGLQILLHRFDSGQGLQEFCPLCKVEIDQSNCVYLCIDGDDTIKGPLCEDCEYEYGITNC